MGKILQKFLRKSSLFQQNRQKWTLSQVFLRDFDKNFRIAMWLSLASEYRCSFICLLPSFVSIIKLLNWLLNSLSKEICFDGNKYLNMHCDLWLRCCDSIRYHPLVKLRSIHKVFFKLTLTLLNSLLLSINFKIN